MRKFLSTLALGSVLGGLLLLSNCSSPLESYPDPSPTGPVVEVDTVILIDTVINSDTIIVTDTLPRSDTVVVIDTVISFDTVLIVDTLVRMDSLVQADTVVRVDTLIQIDTLIRTDTLVQADTLLQWDTVWVTDTVLQVDTVVVYLPDTSSTRTLCTRMGSQQQEIVWPLRVAEGRYRLEFSAYVERGQPPQRVTVMVDDTAYEWLPRDLPELVIEADLGTSPTIMILPDNPGAFGHSIDFCLTLTRL